jgi:hypothetical protein
MYFGVASMLTILLYQSFYVFTVLVGGKSKVKVREIKVQTANAVLPATTGQTDKFFMTFSEPTNNTSDSFNPLTVTDSHNSSTRTFKTSQHNVLRTSDRKIENEDGTETHYGDLVVIDLGSSTQSSVNE